MNSSAAKIFPAGTLLFSIFATVGKCSILEIKAATNQAIAGIQISDSNVELPYLYHYLSYLRPQIESRAKGVAQNNINLKTLKQLEIPLPPLEEQRRIATILEKANSLRNAPPRTEVHINNIVSQFVENRLLRSNEKFVKLSELCDIQSGITKGRKTKKALAAKIPYLAVSNVKDGYLDLSKVKEIEVTNEEIEKYALHKGDILLTEGGDPDKLGRGCLWNDEIPNCLHQNHIFRVRLKDKQAIPANVLMAILSSKELKSYFLKSAKQTTGIASINRTQLSNASIPILDNETIAEIDCLLFMCEKLMATNTSRTLLLDELIQSLSARAFTGEL
ncbi:type I restriction modification DNA specificity domain protein [Corynebacterium glucuronolyticum ATCC 51866]|uniref:Type I restriction modification DNA specificity domain protein n=1 Tax=Corynebacterium glucuronolyticum ATCC 51866 TaxID=548478 RepID=A0ABP2DVM8_9CORY|nr:type I restriction modification DNA specificity domain protein [Corynebacterium glucuronolyticum ATCC 51866]